MSMYRSSVLNVYDRSLLLNEHRNVIHIKHIFSQTTHGFILMRKKTLQSLNSDTYFKIADYASHTACVKSGVIRLFRKNPENTDV